MDTDHRNSGTHYNYTWDGTGRMKVAGLNGSTIATYYHNSVEQRMEKVTGSATTDFLSQNWHRDHDPTIGGYVESDPTGLLGGINLYVYVNGNPTRFVDPLALWCLSLRVRIIHPLLGGVVGGISSWTAGASGSSPEFSQALGGSLEVQRRA